MFRVVGQYFGNRQGDRNRGLSEGLLPMTYVNREFETQAEAEAYVSATFPSLEKMREYHRIEEEI